ncbi:outer membrane protein with beta-barrel domain [Pontibacter ummariensis]|uniref:Outer membrane protein beta-barrel domain-containing protein n=1 Tax=Pontibacter ummariensis TaxID=1610492 RepID=A0A239ILV4_9BACT|nr:outer membrane beta-barrel protein [Pontibacter ummariensis]PRY09743.1 outer membrane protein with beta-barrel domain [Pontibacter ummariensis]SNS94577.1 Outer membrane protein beta-barrel domain-containing protein [Pontibacter ummariensis]
MKTLFAATLFVLSSASAFAQTSSGTVVVSGSVGFAQQAYERTNFDGNSTNIQVFPSIGYFYKDRLEVGISTGFSFGRNTSKSEDGEYISKSYNISAGPYIRKYLPITEKLFFTASAGLSAGIGSAKTKAFQNESFGEPSRSFTYGISAAPGLTYFATEKLGLFVSIGQVYFSRSTTRLEPTDTKSTETYFNADVSPSSSSIGLRYLINR